MLKNISLRLLINGSLAIVAFFALIWLSYLSLDAYQDHKHMQQLHDANEMADDIIEATRYNALERWPRLRPSLLLPPRLRASSNGATAFAPARWRRASQRRPGAAAWAGPSRT